MATPKTRSQRILDRFLLSQDKLVTQSSDLSLGTLSEMVANEVIDTKPSYQRRERWSAEKQSSLIESFLLNVPVPPIYLVEDEFGKYSIVDGKQRLLAINAFIGHALQLSGLDSFKDLEGLSYDQLPKELRNALSIRPYLRVVTLLKQSDSELKYEVFLRLNRGGEKMEPQEIRNVAFRGRLNDLIMELSEHAFLHKRLKIKDKKSPKYRKMQDAEYVLRFFTLAAQWESTSGSLREEMDAYMRGNRNPDAASLSRLRELFKSCLETAKAVWGVYAFKRYEDGRWRNQFLAGMYDAQMVALSLLTGPQRAALVSRRNDIVEATMRLCSDPVFEAAVREGTNTPSRIVYRIQRTYATIK